MSLGSNTHMASANLENTEYSPTLHKHKQIYNSMRHSIFLDRVLTAGNLKHVMHRDAKVG